MSLRLASHTLSRSSEQRPATYIVLGLPTVLMAALAVLSSPWYWSGVALFLGFLALALAQPHRLNRRVTLLATRGPSSAPRAIQPDSGRCAGTKNASAAPVGRLDR